MLLELSDTSIKERKDPGYTIRLCNRLVGYLLFLQERVECPTNCVRESFGLENVDFVLVNLEFKHTSSHNRSRLASLPASLTL